MIATNFSPTSRPPSMQAVFAIWARSGAATRAGLVLALTCSLLAVQPARADLLLRYTFDETDLTNTPALDGGIAPAANGTFVNKATRTTKTPSGTGLALDLSDGISDWVSVGNPAKLNGLSSFTLACWLNLQADPAANDRLMEKQGADGGLGWRIITPTTGTISATNLRLSLQFALVAEADTANLVLATNQWIFLALTYDSTLGDRKSTRLNSSHFAYTAIFRSPIFGCPCSSLWSRRQTRPISFWPPTSGSFSPSPMTAR